MFKREMLAYSALMLAVGVIGALAYSQGEPPLFPDNPIPQWQCNDDGTTTLVANITDEATYRVKNKGPDSSVQVQVYDSQNQPVGDPIDLAHGASVDVGVPLGGDLKVSDPADSNALGATGTYSRL